MPAHFQIQTEKVSDHELGQGFSFTVCEANREGQFSGAVPKSIIPGLQAGAPAKPVGVSQPSLRRAPFEFSELASSNAVKADRLVAAATGFCPEETQHRQNQDVAPSRLHRTEKQDRFELGNNRPISCQIAQSRSRNSLPCSEPCSEKSPTLEPPRLNAVRGETRCRVSPSVTNEDNVELVNHVLESPYFDKSHTLRNTVGRERASAQRCGDLESYEDYATQTPLSRSESIHRNRSYSRYVNADTPLTLRTSSRTSNISRKRALALADSHNSGSDRKRLAMDEAVRHWNECIQITTEESKKAKSKIRDLKQMLRDQNVELRATKAALHDGDVNLQALQNECTELKKTNSDNSKTQTELELQFNQLKQDNGKLREHLDKMSANYDGYESKLNGALSEQQEMLRDSKELLVGLHSRMEKSDELTRNGVLKVEDMLQACNVQGEELVSAMKILHQNSEQQKMSCDEQTERLRRELETYRSETRQGEVDRYCHEMESRQLTQDHVKNIELQLTQFSKSFESFRKEQDETTAGMQTIMASISRLPTLLNFCQLQEEKLQHYVKFDDWKAFAHDQLWPTVAALTAGQGDLQQVVNSLTQSFNSSLGRLQDQIRSGAADLGNKLNAGQKSHKEVKDALDRMSAGQADISSRIENANSRCENIAESLSGSEHSKDIMAEILKAVKGSSENSRILLDKTGHAAEVADTHNQALTLQIDEKLAQNENTMRGLMSQIRAHVNDKIATLQTHLGIHEKGADDGGTLSIPSAKDNSGAEIVKIRTKLRHVEAQLQKVDNVPVTLEKILDFNAMLEETSKFMEKEQHWVQRHLSERATNTNVQFVLDSSISSQSSSDISACSAAQNDSCAQESVSSQGSISGESCGSQSRKVTVHSPGPQTDSPLRVSASQEQRQRRELSKPRSILKVSQATGSTTTDVVSVARGSPKTSEDTIAAIRSTLVESPFPNVPSCFTTMADYMRSNGALNRNGGMGDLADVHREFGRTVEAAIGTVS